EGAWPQRAFIILAARRRGDRLGESMSPSVHYGDIVLCLVGIPLVAPKRTWSGNTRRSVFAHLGHCISPEPQPRRIAVSAAHLVKTHAAWHIDEPAFLRRLYSTFWPAMIRSWASNLRHDAVGGLVSSAIAIPLAVGFGMFAFVTLGDDYF